MTRAPPERMRPELLPEELQRRLLQEVQSFQQPEVSRQLEDFRCGGTERGALGRSWVGGSQPA